MVRWKQSYRSIQSKREREREKRRIYIQKEKEGPNVVNSHVFQIFLGALENPWNIMVLMMTGEKARLWTR